MGSWKFIGISFGTLLLCLYLLRFFQQVTIDVTSSRIDHGVMTAVVHSRNHTAHAIEVSYEVDLVHFPQPSRYSWGGPRTLWRDHPAALILQPKQENDVAVQFKVPARLRTANAVAQILSLKPLP